MATDVVMPQMGESIAEGTIVRWIKKVGDTVDRDEPLFEISTDKVDAEIPSPAAGVVSEIRVKEGETVPVNSIVAVIGAAGEAKPAAEPKTPPAPAAKPPETPKPSPQADGSPASATTAAPAAPPREAAADPSSPRPAERAPRQEPQPAVASTEQLIRQRSSPLVRKIAKEHHVDISQLHGTGIAGRVTKDDILGYLGPEGQEGQEGLEGQEGKAAPAQAAPPEAERGEGIPAERVRGVGAPGVSKERGGGASAERVRGGGAPGVNIEKMSPMRKRIAEHMV